MILNITVTKRFIFVDIYAVYMQRGNDSSMSPAQRLLLYTLCKMCDAQISGTFVLLCVIHYKTIFVFHYYPLMTPMCKHDDNNCTCVSLCNLMCISCQFSPPLMLFQFQHRCLSTMCMYVYMHYNHCVPL